MVPEPQRRPRGVAIGLQLLFIGGLLLAFSTYSLAQLPTPGEILQPDATASEQAALLDLFRERLDENARRQAISFGLIAAGGVLLATTRIPAGAKGQRVLLVAGLAAAALILVARWQSVKATQFGAGWDHWLMAEAIAWGIWAVAILGAFIEWRVPPESET